MQQYTSTYEEICDYLEQKYKRVTLGKKELSNELGIGLSTLDLYMAKGIGVPVYKKLGTAKNSRVIFNITDVARFLSENQIQTM